MRTKLAFSTTYHPQIDKQTKRVNQVIKDMLKTCYMEPKVSWIDALLLMKFTYNNNY